MTIFCYITEMTDTEKHAVLSAKWMFLGHCFSAENESKLLLWWQKIFELGLRQIDFGGDQRPVVRAVLTLVSSLITLGEDKSSTGFLGAIGLGRRSALSPR